MQSRRTSAAAFLPALRGRGSARSFFLCPEDEQRNLRVMPDLRDGAAVKQIAEQPVAVPRHRNQIAVPGFSRLDDFRRRIAEREERFHRGAFRAQLPGLLGNATKPFGSKEGAHHSAETGRQLKGDPGLQENEIHRRESESKKSLYSQLILCFN